MTNQSEPKEWPEWVTDHAIWRTTDERDFLCVMKAYDRFVSATGDAKLAGVLVMAWATLQTTPRGYS